MSYLLYCIVDGARGEPRRKPCFLGYPRASIAVRTGELGAVISRATAADLAPDIPRLLAYARVIEHYNRERTVIPMRYGCTVGSLEEASTLLKRNRSRYMRLLAELEGRIEMSVRIEVRRAPRRRARIASEPTTPPPADAASGDASRRPGMAYLARRSEYYARRAGLDPQVEDIRRQVCAAAEGTFVRHAWDLLQRGRKSPLALHFLVPRDSQRRFRESLAPLCMRSSGSIAVTGPWPPYNFVGLSPAGAPR